MQTQQVASSRLRAIETGRWVVQAAPTGFSAFVTPDGDVLDRTGVGERAVIRHVVALRVGPHVVRHARRPARSSLVLLVALAVAPTVAASAPPSLVDARRRQRSIRTVTGPSFTSDSCISVRKRPVATVAPSRRSAATTASTSGSACSGRAAAIQLGRRPPDVSP